MRIILDIIIATMGIILLFTSFAMFDLALATSWPHNIFYGLGTFVCIWFALDLFGTVISRD